MVVNALAFPDGPVSQTTFDELGIGDGVGPDAASFHGIQDVHGSGKIPLVTEIE